MRCEEVRRRLAELSTREDARDCGADIRAHVAMCPRCAQHVRAQAELSSSLRDASVSDQTDVVPFAAVRTLVENRAAQITNAKTWSLVMSRIARSFTRPAYLIPSVVAVVAVLALTLFPWKVDQPGGYKVAFAGVDKDLALQQFGVQRVLDRLGIADADVEVGDCEASCNLTIKDLRDEAEVGKVVSVMFQLSDCQLLEVAREDDGRVYDAANNKFVVDPQGSATCEFVNQLSEDDQEQVRVVVREVRFGDRPEPEWTSDDGHTLKLTAIKDCSTPCSPDDTHGDSMTLTFDVCGGSILNKIDENAMRIGDEPVELELDPLSEDAATSGPISDFQLNQNYPNPFNAGTTISFTAPDGGGAVTLEVFNIRGQLVKSLADEHVSAGIHEISWDGTDAKGDPVASGIYLYRLKAGDYVETKKMSLLK
jgi:hypothetical protein